MTKRSRSKNILSILATPRDGLALSELIAIDVMGYQRCIDGSTTGHSVYFDPNAPMSCALVTFAPCREVDHAQQAVNKVELTDGEARYVFDDLTGVRDHDIRENDYLWAVCAGCLLKRRGLLPSAGMAHAYVVKDAKREAIMLAMAELVRMAQAKEKAQWRSWSREVDAKKAACREKELFKQQVLSQIVHPSFSVYDPHRVPPPLGPA